MYGFQRGNIIGPCAHQSVGTYQSCMCTVADSIHSPTRRTQIVLKSSVCDAARKMHDWLAPSFVYAVYVPTWSREPPVDEVQMLKHMNGTKHTGDSHAPGVSQVILKPCSLRAYRAPANILQCSIENIIGCTLFSRRPSAAVSGSPAQ